MGITVYGSSRSRTMRVLWALSELDLAFEHVPYAWDDPVLKSETFLALNPAGTIPTLVDDEVTLGESLAITLYLVEKYGTPSGAAIRSPSLASPRSLNERAHAYRWSLWAQSALEPWLQQDEAVLKMLAPVRSQATEWVARGLSVLENTLAKSQWLLGGGFTIADLNVAAILSPSRARTLDLSKFPGTRAWLGRCYARPAARTVRRKYA